VVDLLFRPPLLSADLYRVLRWQSDLCWDDGQALMQHAKHAKDCKARNPEDGWNYRTFSTLYCLSCKRRYPNVTANVQFILTHCQSCVKFAAYSESFQQAKTSALANATVQYLRGNTTAEEFEYAEKLLDRLWVSKYGEQIRG
jgi:hypothetical protein